VPLWLALVLALGSGFVLDLAFPDSYVWIAIFPGLAMLLVALIGRRTGAAFLVGFLAGATFYIVHVPWIQRFLDDSFGALSFVPLLAVAVFEGLFWGGVGILISLAYRWLPRAAFSRRLGVALVPIVVAALWSLRELVTSTFPFGGFSWGRLSFSQSQSPFAELFPWLGASGVSFVIALITASVIEAVRRFSRATALRTATALVAGITVLMLVPAFPVANNGSMRVAAVQGDGRAGYFDRAAYGDLLEAQWNATLPVLDDPAIDVVVWPEGGTDVDPQTENVAKSIFESISGRLDAPLVSGVITDRDGLTFNSSIVWQAGEGVTDFYDKRHPVPFGEYVPLRSIVEPIVPELIGLIGREYTPGSTDPVVRIGSALVGLNICFDIVDDALMRETVDDGAQVVFAQSNNADFGDSDESVQQLEIARIRALELGRSVVVVSTVGQSEIIAPDGSTIDSVPRYTPAAMVDDVPLATTQTPSTLVGAALEQLIVLFGLAVLVGAGIVSRSGRARRS
jgi:apolipoprotein N-acyltransferase